MLGRVAGEAGQYHRLLVPGQYHKETLRQKTQDEKDVEETLSEDGASSNTPRRGLSSCLVNSIAGMCAAFLTSSTGEEKKNAPGLKLLIGAPHPQANYLITHASSLGLTRRPVQSWSKGAGVARAAMRRRTIARLTRAPAS